MIANSRLMRQSFALGISGLAFTAVAVLPRTASALPSFAAQTGQPCTSCHVGGFGPQLTPFGRNFKLGGYLLEGGDGPLAHIPVAGYVETGFEHTLTRQPGGPAPGFATNNNVAIDQVSLFLAGRLTDHLGAFVQGTYAEAQRGFRLDNTDVRLTNSFEAFGNDLVAGLDLNNSPTVEDAYNSTYAWGYPYITSTLVPKPAAGPLLAGALSGNSYGLLAYAWYDRRILIEAGGYDTYGPTLLNVTGSVYGPGSAHSLAPYSRVAYEWNWNNQSAHVGAALLQGTFNPATAPRIATGAFGRDAYLDYAIDADYMFLGDQSNIYTANAILTHEDRNLRGGVGLGTASRARQGLNQVQANVSYFYHQTYGLTVGVSTVWGAADSALYSLAPIVGSANGKPNSNAVIVEADYIPFGKDGSWGYPLANLKLGVQFTAYTEFNGGTKNYDGFGRSASGNDSLYVFSWLAF